MSENKKLNEKEVEKVVGGSHTDQQGDPVKKFVDHMIEKYEAVCRECGKKYIRPDEILPAAYGDLSLCPECNEKKGLSPKGRNERLEKMIKKLREK